MKDQEFRKSQPALERPWIWLSGQDNCIKTIVLSFAHSPPFAPALRGEEIKKSIVLNARGVQNYAEKNYFSPSLRL